LEQKEHYGLDESVQIAHRAGTWVLGAMARTGSTRHF
jgi:hypothetical protein